jgi:hypothetical protein
VRDVFADALWDALKSFFRRAPYEDPEVSEQTIFDFRIVEPGREVTGRLTTNDAAVLRDAIDSLAQLASDGPGVAVWDATEDRWATRPVLPPAARECN